MERDIELDSIYQYDPLVKIEYKTDYSNYEADILAMTKSGALGPTRCHILDCLYKYPLVNKATIFRYLNIDVSDKENSRRASDDLRSLVTMGCVESLKYGELTLYCLASYVRKEWGKKKKYYVISPNLSSPSEILEYAALCQWHISVTHEGNVGNNFVWQEMNIAKTKLLIPSYLEVVRGNRYRIFAISSPRGSSVDGFFEQLASLWDIMEKSKRKDQHTLTVAVCSSFREMEALKQVMEHFEKAEGRTIYFALDQNYDINGLSCLYYYSGNELRTVGIV